MTFSWRVVVVETTLGISSLFIVSRAVYADCSARSVVLGGAGIPRECHIT
jgi:hypothetical protein